MVHAFGDKRAVGVVEEAATSGIFVGCVSEPFTERIEQLTPFRVVGPIPLSRFFGGHRVALRSVTNMFELSHCL